MNLSPETMAVKKKVAQHLSEAEKKELSTQSSVSCENVFQE